MPTITEARSFLSHLRTEIAGVEHDIQHLDTVAPKARWAAAERAELVARRDVLTTRRDELDALLNPKE
jgi:hypothetical protein